MAENSKSQELKSSLLQTPLFLVSIAKGQLEQYLKSLIELIFFPETNSFFSFAETEDEVSIVLDKRGLETFTSITGERPVVAPGIWKAIQVFEGDDALNQSGLISALSTPIIEANITLIYLSTFRTDLLLIQEENADKAFELVNLVIKNLKGRLVATPSIPIDSSIYSQMVITIIEEPLKLAFLDPSSSLDLISRGLLKQFFFAEKCKFFSYSNTPSDISLIVQSLEFFPPQSLQIHTSSWRALQIVSQESGKNVNSLSTALANQNISIYFLSTFHTDFLLIPEEHFENAANFLKKLNIKFSD